jgi:hypothetical protein
MKQYVKVTFKLLKDVSPSTFSALKRRVGISGSQEVRVGLPDNVNHKGNGKAGNTPLSVIGAAHEFGVPDGIYKGHHVNIPERSFLRSGIKTNTATLIQLNRVNLLKIVQGKLSIQQALNQLGIAAVGFVRAYIRKGIPPPLKEKTILARNRTSKSAAKNYRAGGDLETLQGSVTPLVNIGQMIQALTYEVKGKEHV